MKRLMIITLIVFISTIGLILDSFGQQPQYGGILRRINAMAGDEAVVWDIAIPADPAAPSRVARKERLAP